MSVALTQQAIQGGVVASRELGIGSKSASATLTSADLVNDVIEMTGGSAQVLTVPTGIAIAGDVLTITQQGTGAVSVAPGAGLTMNSGGGLRSISGQYLSITIRWRSSTDVLVEGALA